MDEDAGQTQLLFHSTGEVSRRSVSEREKVGETEVEGLPRLSLRAADSEDIHEKIDVFLDRQVLVEAEALGHVADPVLDRRPVGDDVEAVDRDPARGGFDHRRRHPQEGRFPRPVGADKAEDRPPLDGQRDVPDRLYGAETAGDPLDPEEGAACREFLHATGSLRSRSVPPIRRERRFRPFRSRLGTRCGIMDGDTLRQGVPVSVSVTRHRRAFLT